MEKLIFLLFVFLMTIFMAGSATAFEVNDSMFIAKDFKDFRVGNGGQILIDVENKEGSLDALFTETEAGNGLFSKHISYTKSGELYECLASGYFDNHIPQGSMGPPTLEFTASISCFSDGQLQHPLFGSIIGEIQIKVPCNDWESCQVIDSGKYSYIYIAFFSSNYSDEEFNDMITLQSSHNQRITDLENWKQIIETWKGSINSAISTIQTSITSILAILTGHTTTLNNYEGRISTLENQTIPLPNNITSLNYFKYMSSSDRKTIVCGYAIDNKMTALNDLGWNCMITYKTSSSGRVTSTCRCKEIK